MQNTENTEITWKFQPAYKSHWYKDGVLYLKQDEIPERTRKKLDEMVVKIREWLSRHPDI